MAAELARLESLEDSIRQLSSAERTRAVALAQQETVSVAQVLKVGQRSDLFILLCVCVWRGEVVCVCVCVCVCITCFSVESLCVVCCV